MRHAVPWFALALAGCALASATPPRVEVASVQLRAVGVLDQRFDLGLCAYNPNGQDLAFRRVRAGIDVGGRPLVETETESAVVIPPHQAVIVPVAVSTTTRNVGPQLLSVLASGAVEYRVHGSVQLAGLGLTVPFSRSGRLDLLTAGQAAGAVLADRLAGAGPPSCNAILRAQG